MMPVAHRLDAIEFQIAASATVNALAAEFPFKPSPGSSRPGFLLLAHADVREAGALPGIAGTLPD